jgi:hypothetical protein
VGWRKGAVGVRREGQKGDWAGARARGDWRGEKRGRACRWG